MEKHNTHFGVGGRLTSRARRGRRSRAQGQPSWIRESVISLGTRFCAIRDTGSTRRPIVGTVSRGNNYYRKRRITHFGFEADHRRSLGPTSSDNTQSHKPPPRSCRPALPAHHSRLNDFCFIPLPNVRYRAPCTTHT